MRGLVVTKELPNKRDNDLFHSWSAFEKFSRLDNLLPLKKVVALKTELSVRVIFFFKKLYREHAYLKLFVT